jgi:transposase-like protein
VAAEIANGDQLTLTDIARQFNVNPSTCLRWILRGLPDGRGGRVRLAAIRRGKPWLSSRASLEKFLAALPQSVPTSDAPNVRTPTQRERDSSHAEEVLRKRYGI